MGRRLIHPGRSIAVVLVALLIICEAVAAAQDEEPSPIETELVIPAQASPGQTISVLIKYTVTDPGAGAILNYNLYGPGTVVTRNPEPPNPTANTWGPEFGALQGTLEIQVRVADGTDGQSLKHEIEVKWGPKFRKFTQETQIKYIPPTATPRPTARPTARPTQPLPTPVMPTIGLTEARLVRAGGDGELLSTTEADQELVLDLGYRSTGDVEGIRVRIWFEPDVVNLQDVERVDGAYELALPRLPSAPDGAVLVSQPLTGRIRPFADGGETYELRGYASLQLADADQAIVETPIQIETNSVQVSQQALLVVRADVESDVVRTGGSIIVHALCVNLGQVTIRDIQVRTTGLPDGFTLNPEQHVVGEVQAGGGAQERIFAIHVPDDFE